MPPPLDADIIAQEIVEGLQAALTQFVEWSRWEATQCWQSDDFWQGFDKSDRYWGLLRIFVEEMQSIGKDFEVRRKAFRF